MRCPIGEGKYATPSLQCERDLFVRAQAKTALQEKPLEKNIISNMITVEPRVAVVEGRGEFGKTDGGERPRVEAGTRGLGKRQQTEKSQYL
jgi:hypothetical protein